MHQLMQFNAQALEISREMYLTTLPKKHDRTFLVKESPDIANLSGLKIYLKKVRKLELSEKNSSTVSTTRFEKDLIVRKMTLGASYLRNRRSGWEEI